MKKNGPREVLHALFAAGYTQQQIADLITESGVTTTQSTIQRISSGYIKQTYFDLGCAIMALQYLLPTQPARKKKREIPESV
jgi:hypothetical protein